MKKGLLSLIVCGFMSTVFAQQATKQSEVNDSILKSLSKLSTELSNFKNLKISGWIQAQFQTAESKGTKNFDGGDFSANTYNRFMIRRGRVKFTYTKGIGQYVLQVNATERGVNIVDLYGKITEPWLNSFSLTAGIMNRPFGYEIQQSSADRETPERARFTQILLPNERDLGAMITYEAPKGSKFAGFKVDAGFYNGTGIAVPGTTSLNGAGVVEFDSFKDFIGRAAYKKSFKQDKINLGLGLSHYNGGFIYQNNRVFSSIVTDGAGMKTWMLSDTTTNSFKGKKAPRVYYGADIQFALRTKLGTTTIRAEYIMGQQAGMIDETKSPSAMPSKLDSYIRDFNGGYVYLIQRLGKSKHEIVLKYDWYDPNTNVTGADLNGLNGMTKAELKYTMLGMGYNFYATENVKFMVYYNLVKNELAKGLSGYTSDLKDDVFTFRMQYRF